MANVIVIGSGGREHAIGWKIKQSPHVDKVFFAPGNPGTAELGENLAISDTDGTALAAAVKQYQIDLAVVAPDAALAAGVVDAIGPVAFGPSQAAAELEANKIFAYEFNERWNIPQPTSAAFNDPQVALEYIADRDASQLVIKAQGLAAGKGVILPANQAEATEAIDKIMIQKVFGDSGDGILIQERLEGVEVSVFALCAGESYSLFPLCQDYKRLEDGDNGPNTGGMGVVAPVTVLSPEDIKTVEATIIQPVLKGMVAEQNTFNGILYLGLMKTASGIKVIEYNVRFGDPEAQALMTLLKSDLYELLKDAARGKIDNIAVKTDTACAVVVLTSQDYPVSNTHPQPVIGLETAKEVVVFQAGTSLQDNKLIANGGRVLNIVGQALDVSTALAKAYAAIGDEGIHFNGMHYRRDIGSNS